MKVMLTSSIVLVCYLGPYPPDLVWAHPAFPSHHDIYWRCDRHWCLLGYISKSSCWRASGSAARILDSRIDCPISGHLSLRDRRVAVSIVSPTSYIEQKLIYNFEDPTLEVFTLPPIYLCVGTSRLNVVLRNCPPRRSLRRSRSRFVLCQSYL